MPEIEGQRRIGKELLKEVALRYASQHGLRPDKIEWVEVGEDECWLKVLTAEHSVKVVFSIEEIEDFSGGGADTTSSKAKIRNAFSSLSM